MHAPHSAGEELLTETTATPAVELPLLRLRRDEDRRLSAGHLWVFSNEVDVAATPLTRSSYHAGDDFKAMRAARQARPTHDAASRRARAAPGPYPPRPSAVATRGI